MDPEDRRIDDQRHEAPRVHSNAMAAYGGPFDLTLDFGYRAEPEEEPEVQARITMSWEHALAMVKAIQVLVDGYHEQVGPVRDLTAKREETG